MRLFALILLTAIAPVLIPDIDPNMQPPRLIPEPGTPEFDRWWVDPTRDVDAEYDAAWKVMPQWQKDLLLEKNWIIDE